jgi:hypothetical protein
LGTDIKRLKHRRGRCCDHCCFDELSSVHRGNGYLFLLLPFVLYQR